MKIVFYCQNYESFAQAKDKQLRLNPALDSSQIIWCDSKKTTRSSFINDSQPTWMLFLDHDCLVQEKEYFLLLNKLNKLDLVDEINGFVILGKYINPTDPSLLQKAHNWIANSWLGDFENEIEPRLLGGAFVVKKNIKDEIITKIGIGDWGGEDTKLARELKNADFKFILHEDFFVIHETSKSFFHFIKRAYLHGYNDNSEYQLGEKYFKKYTLSNRFDYWLKKVAFLDFDLILPVLFHFSLQITGRLIRKVLRQHK